MGPFGILTEACQAMGLEENVDNTCMVLQL